MIKSGALAIALALAVAAPAVADVVDVQPSGFALSQSYEIAAPRAKVWEHLLMVGSWWNSSHTYSGAAANLSLDPVAGGCWCERTAAGLQVKHLEVIFVDPGKTIRLEGALGPLALSGVTGHLTLQLEEANGKTTLKASYQVGGYMQNGFTAMAPIVDRVIAEQLTRLKALSETGSAG